MKKFNYFKITCAAAALLAASPTFADEFTYNGYTFEVIPEEENHVKLIDVDTSVTGDVVIPSEASFDGNTYTVTQIETWSFNLRDDITSVTVPNTVTVIAEACFVNMPNLTAATLSENLVDMGGYMFQSCNKLETIVIPNSVKIVGNYTLSLCPELKNVTIGNSVKTIGENVFYGDKSLQTVTLPASVEKIETGFGLECSSMTAINVAEGNASFTSVDGVLYDKNLTTLLSVPAAKENVTMPNTVKVITEHAFNRSTAIKTVTLSTTLEEIGGWALYECLNLESISQLPETLQSIGPCAFANCGKLSSEIVIPAATTVLYEGMFYGTSSLPKLSVSPDNIYFASKDDVIYNKYFTEVIASACSISEFDLPETVKSIAGWAFCCNKNLKTVKLPKNVTKTGSSSFNSCSNLESVELGEKFKEIGSSCFSVCDNLTEIICKNTTPPVVQSQGLPNTAYANATLYIPKGSLSAYTAENAAPWNQFQNIVEVDFSGVEGVEADAQATEPVDYYSIDGRRVSPDTKGIVIVRYSDDSVKRIINK